MTIDEAIAAIRTDPWCPADATDEQLRGWAQLMLRTEAHQAAVEERRLATKDRAAATIVALKIALEQAAEALDHAATCSLTGEGVERAMAKVARYRLMAAPDWEALPVELTAPGADA